MKKTAVIGGDFGIKKSSAIIVKLSNELDAYMVNGGDESDIRKISENLQEFDLIIWAPNVSNEVDKIYPKKSSGAVLICTKVMREHRDFEDAVARIFKMNANAVITIESSERPFVFTLMDALGNIWCKTSDLVILSEKIKELYFWTKASIRVRSGSEIFSKEELIPTALTELCEVVKTVADRVENERGGRYFGNVSTRCGKMFPSYRAEYDIVLMSQRNVSKNRISPEDFVYTKMVDEVVLYHGNKKPSVDTPIQLNLYKKYKNINFLIHGHAYIDDAKFTSHYYPCGDLREVAAVVDEITDGADSIILNLKNHGFVIGANSLTQLNEIVNRSVFRHRKVGIEIAETSAKAVYSELE